MWNRKASSTQNRRPRGTEPAAVLAFAALVLSAAVLSGCRVNVNQSANGQQKSVQVDTPFGGVHVNTDQTTAADLGLPVYPGARMVVDKDNGQSADVNLGFGNWQLRVKAVNYATPDAKDKVLAYYKKALGRYGNVIECQGNAPVGTPGTTSEGLSCADGNQPQGNAIGSAGGHGGEQSGFTLKAGSKRHQHLVCFQNSAPGQTRFALVEIELPAAFNGTSD